MTLLTQESKIIYSGIVGQDVFAYNFRVDDEDDMEVYLGGIIINPSAYVVDGIGNPTGGNVTLNDPLDVNQSVTLLRDVPYTQEVDYQPFDAFPAETHEQALDNLTMLTQQLDELIHRNPVPPPDSEEGDSLIEGNLTVNGTSSFIGGGTFGAAATGVAPTGPSHLTRRDYVDAVLPAGTRLIFQQSTPPVTWTKDVGVNNNALRVVSGPVTGGGSDPFTTVFGAGKSSAGHAITAAQMPAHSHTISNVCMAPGAEFSPDGISVFPINQRIATGNTNAAGSNNAHSHGLVMDLRYTDVVIGVKN